MRVFMTLFAVTVALPLFANQQYRGPLLSRDIGKENVNLGLISSCQLLGNNAAIKWDDVYKDIAQAVKDAETPSNFEKRQYVKFNAPSKSYVVYKPIEEAGKPPRLKQVVLFSDGGSYDLLKTDASRRLLKVITDNCGALKQNQGGGRLGIAESKKDIFDTEEFKPNGTEFKD